MIVEISDDNSIIKWKMNDKDDWKSAEISDLINAYEKRSNEQIAWEQGYEAGIAQGRQEVLSGFHQGVKTETKNPREGMDFKDYLAEKLKDPEFKKEWENVLKEEKNNEKDSNII